MDKTKVESLLENIASAFERALRQKLKNRICSIYVVGSYATGKISVERPDLNILIILNGGDTSEDYLRLGVCVRQVIKEFRRRCSIRVEFRPFRYIYPTNKKGPAIFLAPIIYSTNLIKANGYIFSKWFTEGLKSANRLLYGDDVLKRIRTGAITRKDVKARVANFDLYLYTVPLLYAPAQYGKDDSDLLLNEAMNTAKGMCYLGIEAAMSGAELKNNEYNNIIQNKETMAHFYSKRYGRNAALLVKEILEARKNYLKYRRNQKKAERMFVVALALGDLIRKKLRSD